MSITFSYPGDMNNIIELSICLEGTCVMLLEVMTMCIHSTGLEK